MESVKWGGGSLDGRRTFTAARAGALPAAWAGTLAITRTAAFATGTAGAHGAHGHFLAGIDGGFAFLGAEFAVAIRVVFFEEILVPGLHVGLQGGAFVLAEFAVAVRVVLGEHGFAAFFRFGTEGFAGGLAFVLAELAVTIGIEFRDDFGRQLAVAAGWSLWASAILGGGGDGGACEKRKQGDDRSGFHGCVG